MKRKPGVRARDEENITFGIRFQILGVHTKVT